MPNNVELPVYPTKYGKKATITLCKNKTSTTMRLSRYSVRGKVTFFDEARTNKRAAPSTVNIKLV